jgi:hypothetical protein
MSHPKIRTWSIVLVLVILLSSIAACGAGNPLLGKWQDEEGIVLEFKDDNTFSISAMGMSIEGTYKLNGSQVTLSAPDLDDSDIVLDFTISGDKLSMTDDTGDVTEFTRVK